MAFRSSEYMILPGVPRGSVMGPILFNKLSSFTLRKWCEKNKFLLSRVNIHLLLVSSKLMVLPGVPQESVPGPFYLTNLFSILLKISTEKFLKF